MGSLDGHSLQGHHGYAHSHVGVGPDSSNNNDEDDASPPPAGAAAGGAGPRRPRGRPPGSKNKPKPPPVVTRDVEPAAAMRPHMLEIHSGGDVARALAGFARRRGLGICVLAGTGAVADVSLRHPASASSADGGAAAVVVFRVAAVRDLSISLASPHGQILGALWWARTATWLVNYTIIQTTFYQGKIFKWFSCAQRNTGVSSLHVRNYTHLPNRA